MSKKEQILKHYDAWIKGETPKRIANLVGTTRQYVMQVMHYKNLEKEFNKRDSNSTFSQDLTEKDEIIEPDYVAYAEPDVVPEPIEYQEITLLPKVDHLADGRTELIYESKLNYES